MFTILPYRNSHRGLTSSNKAYNNSQRLSPVLTHIVPPPPGTPPPPDESTTYESVLTTSTPTDITQFNDDVTIDVSNVEGDDTAFKNSAEDYSFM